MTLQLLSLSDFWRIDKSIYVTFQYTIRGKPWNKTSENTQQLPYSRYRFRNWFLFYFVNLSNSKTCLQSFYFPTTRSAFHDSQLLSKAKLKLWVLSVCTEGKVAGTGSVKTGVTLPSVLSSSACWVEFETKTASISRDQNTSPTITMPSSAEWYHSIPDVYQGSYGTVQRDQNDDGTMTKTSCRTTRLHHIKVLELVWEPKLQHSNKSRIKLRRISIS